MFFLRIYDYLRQNVPLPSIWTPSCPSFPPTLLPRGSNVPSCLSDVDSFSKGHGHLVHWVDPSSCYWKRRLNLISSVFVSAKRKFRLITERLLLKRPPSFANQGTVSLATSKMCFVPFTTMTWEGLTSGRSCGWKRRPCADERELKVVSVGFL